MGKFLTLPASCHYLYSKRADYYNKSDLKCFVMAGAISINKKSPKNYGSIRLDEAIPSGATLRTKYTILNKKAFDKNIKNGGIQKAMKNICKKNVLRPLFLEGLEYVNIFYLKNKKEVRKIIITKKECGIKD